MADKEKDFCCMPGGSGFKVEAILSVDERGQMVLPKDMRERANVRAGDKFALVSWEKEGKVCCLSLIKVEELAGLVKDVLEPLVEEIMK